MVGAYDQPVNVLGLASLTPPTPVDGGAPPIGTFIIGYGPWP
jgi:hypothetical protein